MEDQRKDQRIRFGFRVEDAAGKTVWMAEDISSGGCFLQAVEKAPVGAKISLAFQLPGSAKYIEAMGEVKHTGERGMGIEFVTMDPDSKEETERFVGDYMKYQDHPSKN
jgi:hypothetical protein